MRRISIVGLCLLAALAASAIAVASASAANPEYLACGKAAKSGKKYTGKYTNKTCSTTSATSEGKYERVAITKFPVKFKAKSGETKIYLFNPETKEIVSEVPCKKDKDEGAVINATEATVKIKYEDCAVPASGKFPGPCNTKGQKAGVVVTEPLVEKLVWLNEAETEPGISLAPATHGGLFEEAACADEKVIIKQYGDLAGKIGPVGEASKLLTVSFLASPTTGEPASKGFYEGGLFTEDKLVSDISGLATYENVPTSLTSTEPQKGAAVLVS